jgi:hypothetical protein
LWLLLRATLPKSYRKKRIIDLVSSSVDIGSFFSSAWMTVSRALQND